jgi:hypothetical protein
LCIKLVIKTSLNIPVFKFSSPCVKGYHLSTKWCDNRTNSDTVMHTEAQFTTECHQCSSLSYVVTGAPNVFFTNVTRVSPVGRENSILHSSQYITAQCYYSFSVSVFGFVYGNIASHNAEKTMKIMVKIFPYVLITEGYEGSKTLLLNCSQPIMLRCVWSQKLRFCCKAHFFCRILTKFEIFWHNLVKGLYRI